MWEAIVAYGESIRVAPLVGRLSPDRLTRRCAASALMFDTTGQAGDDVEIIGQQRATDAIGFGVAIAEEGYNLFAMGSEGIGRRTLARRFLDQAAASRRVPSDWCYLFNFHVPHRPRAIALAAGRGVAFKRDMMRLVDDLRIGIPAAFEADEYRTRRQEIESELSERQEHAMHTLGERAKQQNIGLLRTPAGFAFAPFAGDEVMSPDKFNALPDDEKKRIEQAVAVLQGEVDLVIEQVPKWRREAQHKLRELDRQVTRGAIASLIDEMKSAYQAMPAIVHYLGEVQEDVLDHAHLFLQPKEGEPAGALGFVVARPDAADALRRYEVNLLIDHCASTSAPVVYEDHPTHDNLIGRIDHLSHLGALTTDFTLIKAGALHRANGGYLILDALKLLTQPLAWDALKRALRSREVQTEPLAQALGLISTQSLEPEPIPLDVKIVLIGQRDLYYLLHAWDPEFGKLFKVAVDFEDDMERSAESELHYARLVAAMAHKNGLRPFERTAVARVIEQASRTAGSAERLSVEMSQLLQLLVESNYWAGARNHLAVTSDDVQHALDARLHRLDRVPVHVRDEMLHGRLLVATEGDRVGQVNGLSVAELGGELFGIPVRITARVRLGSGSLVDIERESQLGGRIHSKGVLILAGYLAAHYAPKKPLSLSATLVFEQTYGTIEGDSASSAELYALLSALADVPLSNSIAITGSVNQHGDVQAVGAVNEKIEGYFDLCKQRGLTGDQGVIVPSANVSQLMLRDDVIEAVAAGRFSVYAVQTIDQGLEILAAMASGTRNELGRFAAGTLNARIEERLDEFAERARAFATPRERRPQRHDAGRK
jgi:lon-related putative ATP-dependent protease